MVRGLPLFIFMEKELILLDQKIKYQLRKSPRARRVRITIASEGRVTLTMPRWGSEFLATKFLESKINWILQKLEIFRTKKSENDPTPYAGHSKRDYLKNKMQALELAKERLAYFNQFYGFSIAKISIRNQKTRWGSCSRNGNLSFNYKIIYLPPNLADYIIVHELCHLGQFNHSEKFWSLVGQTVSDHRKIRREVRKL